MPEGAPELTLAYSAAYEELRRLAATIRRDHPAATLCPTALVNEAYLKLTASPGFQTESVLHFKRIVARAMRQVLIESARRRRALRRGRAYTFVTYDEELDSVVAQADDLLAIHAALEELAQVNPRQATIVECRFFGGFNVSETAELLGISEATAARDWRAAKAWLSLILRRAK